MLFPKYLLIMHNLLHLLSKCPTKVFILIDLTDKRTDFD